SPVAGGPEPVPGGASDRAARRAWRDPERVSRRPRLPPRRYRGAEPVVCRQPGLGWEPDAQGHATHEVVRLADDRARWVPGRILESAAPSWSGNERNQATPRRRAPTRAPFRRR